MHGFALALNLARRVVTTLDDGVTPQAILEDCMHPCHVKNAQGRIVYANTFALLARATAHVVSPPSAASPPGGS
ncbi:MAG: hypothetical protein NXI32_19260 [bacterium]|nr:hypothetical protein [bacterium]